MRCPESLQPRISFAGHGLTSNLTLIGTASLFVDLFTSSRVLIVISDSLFEKDIITADLSNGQWEKVSYTVMVIPCFLACDGAAPSSPSGDVPNSANSLPSRFV